MPDGRLRLGFLYPGYAAGDDYPYLAERLQPTVTVDLIHTSVGEDAHRVDALLDLGSDDRLVAGTDQLRALGVASAVWACTSGSFVFGWEGAHEQAASIEKRLGAPASSTSLAFVDACRALGATRVAIAATYPADVTDHLVAFLAMGGVDVVSVSSQGIVTAEEVGTLGEESVRDLVRRHDHPDAHAVLAPDTALHTARWLPRLEGDVGKAVLTANQVSVWQAARLAGHRAVGRHLGRLLQPRS